MGLLKVKCQFYPPSLKSSRRILCLQQSPSVFMHGYYVCVCMYVSVCWFLLFRSPLKPWSPILQSLLCFQNLLSFQCIFNKAIQIKLSSQFLSHSCTLYLNKMLPIIHIVLCSLNIITNHVLIYVVITMWTFLCPLGAFSLHHCWC